MASKVKKSSAPAFAKGGSGKMFGKQHAGQQASGQTATKSGAGGKWAKGGSTKMFGKQSANPRRPGVTGK
ncbi:MAG: hypothetical protein E6R03_00625 [Hyphomicrobiaceae bacterium]|nr:MAG: hypothetical protein E6R03_00625 [Hyphomicrobiaceae bacterium]